MGLVIFWLRLYQNFNQHSIKIPGNCFKGVLVFTEGIIDTSRWRKETRVYFFFKFIDGLSIIYLTFFNGIRFMVLDVTYNNISVISWRSISLVGETGVPREIHRPAASNWQTLSHNVYTSPWAGFEHVTLVAVIGTDRTGKL